jgi:hypothetical protein
MGAAGEAGEAQGIVDRIGAEQDGGDPQESGRGSSDGGIEARPRDPASRDCGREMPRRRETPRVHDIFIVIIIIII